METSSPVAILGPFHAPDVRRLRLPSAEELQKPAWERPEAVYRTSLDLVRRNLMAGRCQLRVVVPPGPGQDRERPRVMLAMLAFDLARPGSYGIFAVLQRFKSTWGRTWESIGFFERATLELRSPGSPELAWMTPRWRKDALAVMGDLLALVRDPTVRDWPDDRFVSQLGTCARCGRDLSDDVSRQRGVGPECFEAMSQAPAVRALAAILNNRSEEEVVQAWNAAVTRLEQMGLLEAAQKRARARGAAAKRRLAARAVANAGGACIEDGVEENR